MSWTAKIHWADEEYGTSAYNETALTNVTALAGYDHDTYSVIAVDEGVEGAGAIQYANGSLQSSRLARRTYSIKSDAWDFNTFGRPTNTLLPLMQKAYLWIEVNTYAQNSSFNVGDTPDNYHTANYVIPVTIDTVSVEHDHDNGIKTYTLELKHRFFQS